MKPTRLLFLTAILTTSCSYGVFPNIHPAHISYYDRNHDGKVDLETHHYPGVADADWELLDENFNGRYEKKILFGIGVFESAVDIPVPSNVKIQKGRRF
jgi:hypothetical protein